MTAANHYHIELFHVKHLLTNAERRKYLVQIVLSPDTTDHRSQLMICLSHRFRQNLGFGNAADGQSNQGTLQCFSLAAMADQTRINSALTQRIIHGVKQFRDSLSREGRNCVVGTAYIPFRAYNQITRDILRLRLAVFRKMNAQICGDSACNSTVNSHRLNLIRGLAKSRRIKEGHRKSAQINA